MILNAHVESHDMYLHGRRLARPRVPVKPAAVVTAAAAPGVRPNPNGTLEEKCAWMRSRRRRKK